MIYDTLLFDIHGDIGILTLNRPEKVNAINHRMLLELNEFWDKMHQDFDIRVVIVKGGGEKGFCSGLDLKEIPETLQTISPEDLYNLQGEFSRVVRLMRTCPQPIIAAVHGPAMGGGLAMALASDIRLAGEGGFFCAQFINIGIGGADMGTSFLLPKIVGAGLAAEMALTGNKVYAEDARRIGLANYVYPEDKLLPAAMAMAENMCTKDKLSLRFTKEAFNAALNGSSLENATRMEDRNQSYLVLNGRFNNGKGKANSILGGIEGKPD
ncbi:MAG: enoyl-CoA hydratase/isomerase family protein [Actinobacteria bacterium]|nr:enoyl-CoA hydratase/isomerase family protein [Actinomycetota bacterium]